MNAPKWPGPANSETEVQRRFFKAIERRANAAELDALLIDVRIEHRIRRNALDLAHGLIHPRNLTLLADLIEAALKVRDACDGTALKARYAGN